MVTLCALAAVLIVRRCGTNDAAIVNLREVEPGLLRGGQPSEAGFAALRERGVRTVIDLRGGHDENALVASLGMKPVHIPISSGNEAAPTLQQIEQFLAVVRDPANQPVFVHCKLGRDRTGAFCAVYRMEVDGWTRERALDEMRALGFQEKTVGLTSFLKSYTPSRERTDGR